MEDLLGSDMDSVASSIPSEESGQEYLDDFDEEEVMKNLDGNVVSETEEEEEAEDRPIESEESFGSVPELKEEEEEERSSIPELKASETPKGKEEQEEIVEVIETKEGEEEKAEQVKETEIEVKHGLERRHGEILATLDDLIARNDSSTESLKQFLELFDNPKASEHKKDNKFVPFRTLLCHTIVQKCVPWLCNQDFAGDISDFQRLTNILHFITFKGLNYDCVETRAVLESITEPFLALVGNLCDNIKVDDIGDCIIAPLLVSFQRAVPNSFVPSNAKLIIAGCQIVLARYCNDEIVQSGSFDSVLSLAEELLDKPLAAREVLQDDQFVDFVLSYGSKQQAFAMIFREKNCTLPAWLTSSFLETEEMEPRIFNLLGSDDMMDDSLRASQFIVSDISPIMISFLERENNAKEMVSWIASILKEENAVPKARIRALSFAFAALKKRDSVSILQEITDRLLVDTEFLSSIQQLVIQPNLAEAKVSQFTNVIVCDEEERPPVPPKPAGTGANVDHRVCFNSANASYMMVVPELHFQFRKMNKTGSNKDEQDMIWEASQHEHYISLAEEHMVEEDARDSTNNVMNPACFEDQLDEHFGGQDADGDINEDSGPDTVSIYNEASGGHALLVTNQLGKLVDLPATTTTLWASSTNSRTIIVGNDAQQVKAMAGEALLKSFGRKFESRFGWEILVLLASLNRRDFADQLESFVLQRSDAREVHHFRLGFTLMNSLVEEERLAALGPVWNTFVQEIWQGPQWEWDWSFEKESVRMSLDPRKIHCDFFRQSTPWSLEECLQLMDSLPKCVSFKKMQRWKPAPLTLRMFMAPFELSKEEEAAICNCEDMHATLLWLSSFGKPELSKTMESTSESDFQTRFRMLLHLAKTRRFPGVQTVALGTVCHLLSQNVRATSSFFAKHVDELVQIGLSEEAPTSTMIMAFHIVELVCRYNSSSVMNNFEDLKNLGSFHHNDYLVGLLNTITWQREIVLDESNQIFQKFFGRYEYIPNVFRSRSLKYLALSETNLSNELLESNELLFEEYAFAQLAWKIDEAFFLDHYEKLENLVVYHQCVNKEDTSPEMAKLFQRLVTTSINATLTTLICFGSAFQAPLLRAIVESHCPVFVDALEQGAAELDHPTWVAQTWKDLLPIAAASHLHVVSGASSNDSFERIVNNHISSKATELVLRGGRISGSDLLNIGSNVLERFPVIDLSNNEIGDDGAATVAGWLADHKIESIDLSRNEIGAKGLGSIAYGLRCSEIQSLCVSANNLYNDGEDTTGIIALAESIIWNTNLKTLDLSFNALSGRAVQHLSRALRYNGSLHQFNLEGTGASSEQLGIIYEKISLNRDGVTVSPHVGRGRKKSERVKKTMELLYTFSLPESKRKTSPCTSPTAALNNFVFKKTLLDNYGIENDERTEDQDLGGPSQAAEELKRLQESLFELRAKEKQIQSNNNIKIT